MKKEKKKPGWKDLKIPKYNIKLLEKMFVSHRNFTKKTRITLRIVLENPDMNQVSSLIFNKYNL